MSKRVPIVIHQTGSDISVVPSPQGRSHSRALPKDQRRVFRSIGSLLLAPYRRGPRREAPGEDASRVTAYERGFSLMEVLVGVAILGIVYSILFGLMSSSLRNVGRIEEREKVIRYGQMKLNELAIKANQGQSEQILAGQFDEKYRWQAKVERISFGEDADKNNSYRLASVHLSVIWAGRSQQNQYELETTTWVPREE